ncbi:MAG: hypothetical protein ACKO2K_06585, partial [Alphaproteobacteria bacterium]
MNRPSPIRPAILCLAFAAACGGTSSAPGPASRGGVLSNGVKVDVSATGAVSLSLDGRPMLAMPEGAPPVVRSFDESYQGATAIWTFARTGVSEEAITGLRAVRRDGDVVVVELGDPAATTRAVLRVHP